MSINLKKDNSYHEDDEDEQTLREYLMELIIQIYDDAQEKTNEEILLHSLEKKSKNIPPTRVLSNVQQYYEKLFDNKGNCINIKCNYCDQIYTVNP